MIQHPLTRHLGAGDCGSIIRHALIDSDTPSEPIPYQDLREGLLVDDLSDETIAEIWNMTMQVAMDAEFDRTMRELLTQISLHLSLCPVHLVDYAICFDDLPESCAQIRMIHPLHDT